MIVMTRCSTNVDSRRLLGSMALDLARLGKGGLVSKRSSGHTTAWDAPVTCTLSKENTLHVWFPRSKEDQGLFFKNHPFGIAGRVCDQQSSQFRLEPDWHCITQCSVGLHKVHQGG
jgi:hypothetical protein